MITAEVLREYAETLASGGEVSLPDGRKLRPRQEADDCATIDDFADCYGRIVPIQRNREYPTRPEGFDGFARKLRTPSGGVFWWQPPADLRSAKREPAYVKDAQGTIHRHPYAFHDPIRDAERAILDILEYGFVSLGVETLSDCDSCHRPQVLDCAWIGGVEAMTPQDHLVDLFSDLVDQVLDDHA